MLNFACAVSHARCSAATDGMLLMLLSRACHQQRGHICQRLHFSSHCQPWLPAGRQPDAALPMQVLLKVSNTYAQHLARKAQLSAAALEDKAAAMVSAHKLTMQKRQQVGCSAMITGRTWIAFHIRARARLTSPCTGLTAWTHQLIRCLSAILMAGRCPFGLECCGSPHNMQNSMHAARSPVDWTVSMLPPKNCHVSCSTACRLRRWPRTDPWLPGQCPPTGLWAGRASLCRQVPAPHQTAVPHTCCSNAVT